MKCQNCEYIGGCPHLESGDCEGGPYSYTVEDGRCYQWIKVEDDSPEGGEHD
jgi:hypothetical protein